MAGYTQLIESREVFLGNYRLETARANVEAWTVEELSANYYRHSTMIKEPGLLGGGISGEAFWEAGDDGVDVALQSQQRERDVPIVLTLDDDAEGGPCRYYASMVAQYTFGGAHGELTGAEYSASLMDPPRRATVMANQRERTGNYTAGGEQLGPVPSGSVLRAVLFVFGGSGQLSVGVQSSSTAAFTSQTSRITFGAVTTGTVRTHEMRSFTGTTTHEYWRVVATLGASLTRDFAVVAFIEEE